MDMELTQEFYFEAAHTLDRDYGKEPSRRVHGHTYHAEVSVRGNLDPANGMIMDLAILRAHINAVREMLDHRLLDTIEGLGQPTIENLALFIGRRMRTLEPRVCSVKIYRKASGDSCHLEL